MPGGTYVCSASLKGLRGIYDAREVAQGSRPIRKLMFSKLQRALYGEHARGDRPGWPFAAGADHPAEVQVLGGRVRPLGSGRDVVLPGRLRILELSTKCPPSQAFLAVAEFRAMLGRARHRLER
jgi:hypothetical protein